MTRAEWCGPAVYDAAARFRENCLLEDGSLFTPGSAVWTPPHVSAVGERVGVEDYGSGSFIDKLEAQLRDLSPEEIQLGAELLYVQLLAELDTHGDTRREHVSRILGLLPREIRIPEELHAALDEGGVAKFGAAKNRRDASVRLLARLFVRVKEADAEQRTQLLTSPWAFHALVSELRTSTDAMQANATLHLLFPDTFEYMISERHRARLIEAFSAAPGVAEADGPDRAIATIRALAEAGTDSELNLYEEPFERIWKEDAPPRWAETVYWASRLYDHPTFDQAERNYKLEVAARLAVARNALLSGDGQWLSQLRAAFTDSRNNLTSWQAHDRLLRWCEANPAPAAQLLRALWTDGEPVLTRLHAFFEGLPQDAARGAGTRVSLGSFLLLALDATRHPFFKATVHSGFARLVGADSPDVPEIDADTVYRPEDLAARLGLDGRRVRDFLRERYPRSEGEQGSSWLLTPEQAQSVLEQFGDESDPAAEDARYADWLRLLEELRLRMLASGTPIRDLLDAQGLAWWLLRNRPPDDWSQPDQAAFEAFRDGKVDGPSDEVAGTHAGPEPADIYAAYRERGLIFSDEVITSFLLALRTKPFVILSGISGTGKTKLAQGLAAHLEARKPAAQRRADPRDDEHTLHIRLTEPRLRRARVRLRLRDQEMLLMPERGKAHDFDVTLPDGTAGRVGIYVIRFSDPTRHAATLGLQGATAGWLRDRADVGDWLKLTIDDERRVTAIDIVKSDGSGPESTDSSSRHALIAVKSDWTDPRGLLGYYNPLTDRYTRTPLLNLVLDAGADPTTPYLAVLDEMNLARVEHYFSDFLSGLESGEPIDLRAERGDADDEDAELEPETPSRIMIPSNLLFVGTVNVDESTHAFSAKVLDRANVLEFTDVDVERALGGDVLAASAPFRLREPRVPPAWLVASLQAHRDAEERAKGQPAFAGWLRGLHSLLADHHLHFGYRVIDEMARFVGFALEAVDADEDAIVATAFDLQLVQKVLPKLAGGRELEAPLSELLAWTLEAERSLDGRGPEEILAAARERLAGPEPPAFPRAASKLTRMLGTLVRSGYVAAL